MRFLLVILILAPAISFAHIDDGMWKGQDENGQECTMEVLQNYFENSTPHPLNERIKVKVNGDEFVLRHPAVIDVAQKSAAFNHDMFEAVLPHAKGAKAMVVTMLHSADQEGPTEYHVINHEYRANKRELVSCKSLKFVK